MLTNYHVLFLIIFGVGLYLLQKFIFLILNEYINYLHSLGRATPILLRSEVAKSQRYGLIQKLVNIKKNTPYMMIFIFMLIWFCFNLYIWQNNKKITEDKITLYNILNDEYLIEKDSLQLLINNKIKEVDSLKIEINYQTQYNCKLEEMNKHLQKTINGLFDYD